MTCYIITTWCGAEAIKLLPGRQWALYLCSSSTSPECVHRSTVSRQPLKKPDPDLSCEDINQLQLHTTNNCSEVHKKYLSLLQSHSSGRFFFRWPLTSLRFFILFCKVSIFRKKKRHKDRGWKNPAWFSLILTFSNPSYCHQELPLHYLPWLSLPPLTSIFKLSSFPEGNYSRRKLVQFACSDSWLWKRNAVLREWGTHSCR